MLEMGEGEEGGHGIDRELEDGEIDGTMFD